MNSFNNSLKYTSFSEFLRPRKLDELTLPTEKIAKLQAMIDSKNVMSMIFYGSPGTGKTTCANIIANAHQFDHIFINASLNSGMKEVREIIEPFTTAMSLYESKKLILLDEADRLSADVQSALRGIIEQSSAHCRFILTVNKISKIDPALQSRCLPICFDSPLQSMPDIISKVTSTIQSRLIEINATIDESKVHQFVRLNYPDYRTIANKIQFELL
jgi:replication-associated recombination protein RarA